ncbi:glycosyltransferase family 1 protein [Aquibium carbonis]|uniref:Glycosyltransferase family 1 protein n=1 Tax=Aquibium carbonis TaxID=2495581 RepID=A0A3R9YU84_9HYPH|nr:glycosyltransferase [Aquibium carbonis]RST87201.1 glycosyltransferase family 1 protein [Aquibium carbonis]
MAATSASARAVAVISLQRIVSQLTRDRNLERPIPAKYTHQRVPGLHLEHAVSRTRSLKHFFRKHIWARHPYAPDAPERLHGHSIYAHRVSVDDAVVIHTQHNPLAPLGVAQFIGRQLRGNRALFLVTLTWSTRSPNIIRRLASIVDIYRYHRPEHLFLFLCNEPEEVKLLSAAGLDAVLCNHNAFVDEFEFDIGDHDEKRFRAIYNGAMIPWKRHELAREVEDCAFVYYHNNDISMDEAVAYLKSLQAVMPRHTFVNRIRDGAIERLPLGAVRDMVSRCRVGLCLSAEEGAMKASIEYLLCGLPVVSTRSVGGRDQFAGRDYWLTVDDEPEAVRDGVADIIARAVAPDAIRNATIARMREHRDRLRLAVERLTDGRVRLPSDLRDRAYRPPHRYVAGRDLVEALGLQAHARTTARRDPGRSSSGM